MRSSPPSRLAFRTGLRCIPLLCIALSPTYSRAEAPTLTRLFPPGAARGQTVTVEATGKFGSGEVRVWTSRPGVEWKPADEANKFTVTVADDAEPGVMFVRIADDGGASATHPFVVGHLPERVEEEPNGELAQANRIEQNPIVFNAVLGESGDVDGYRLTVNQGQTIVAGVSAETGLGSPVDACLQIVGAEGHVVAQNLDYHGLDPQIVWTAPETSEVIVRVFGFPAAPNSTIALAGNVNYLYRLTITTGPFVEGLVPLAVRKDQPTPARLAGWNLPPDAAPVSLPAVTDSEEHTFVHAGAPGVFVLPVVSAPIFSVPVPIDQDAPIHQITIPVNITGSIHLPGQRDTFEFEASAGSKWILSVASRSLGYPLDAVLEIQDATGKQLAREDDTGGIRDPLLRWTAPSEGRYRVSVSDLNGVGGDHRLYRLAIEPEVADYSLTVASDQFQGKVGEVLEIPIQVERLGGFAEAVEITIPEIPAGLTVESVASGVEGDAAKMAHLKLTATAPLNQPIRILGHAAQQPDSKKPVTDAAHGLEEIWVTFQ